MVVYSDIKEKEFLVEPIKSILLSFTCDLIKLEGIISFKTLLSVWAILV